MLTLCDVYDDNDDDDDVRDDDKIQVYHNHKS